MVIEIELIPILCTIFVALLEIFFDDEFEDEFLNNRLITDLENIIIILNKYNVKNPALRLQGYVEKIIPSYTDMQFKSHFR